MSTPKEWYYEKLAQEVCRALERNNIKGIYVKTGKEARDLALSLIPKGCNIGLGGSTTLREIGVLQALRDKEIHNGDYTLIDQYEKGISPEENMGRRRRSLLSDVLLTSTNAITLKGQLVNIDGTGNRVAALLFGPNKVIVITGMNKVVRDVEEGVRRIKEKAAPMNCNRLDYKTPCARTGICDDENCLYPERMCNLTSIIDVQPLKDRMTVILVGEDLGF